MNCPACNQSYASDTFDCRCGCKVMNGQVVDLSVMPRTELGQVLFVWRTMKLMLAGIAVIGLGIFMIVLRERLYGLLLIGVGIAIIVFLGWFASVSLRSRPPENRP